MGFRLLPWCVRGFMICLRVQALPSRLHRIMQKAFASVVSFQIRLQSHTSQKACGVSSAFPGLLSCYCPSIGFRFNAFSCLSDAFSFRKRCSVCPRERKWLINDSCAFSDERPREGFASGAARLHLHPGDRLCLVASCFALGLRGERVWFIT